MIENKLVKKLRELNYTISFAESCTGGMLASTIINVSGSSNVIKESYITYSEDAKMKVLNVKKDTLEKHTVYSKEVAIEMVEGLRNISKSDVCVSVTGIAESSNNVCSCDFAIMISGEIFAEKYETTGSRNDVRANYTKHILAKIIEKLA